MTPSHTAAVCQAGTDEFDAVLQRLLRAAGTADTAMSKAMRALRSLRAEYPSETPAGLLHRARKRGAPIPPMRCAHHVIRGECVACDPMLGERFYFSSGGTHIHTTPACTALEMGQEKVRRRGGTCAPIEVVRIWTGLVDRRDPCRVCFGRRLVKSRVKVPSARPVWRPAVGPRASSLALATLVSTRPPPAGTRIAWSGYEGIVVSTSGRGVDFSSEGLQMTVPWGERARLALA